MILLDAEQVFIWEQVGIEREFDLQQNLSDSEEETELNAEDYDIDNVEIDFIEKKCENQETNTSETNCDTTFYHSMIYKTNEDKYYKPNVGDFKFPLESKKNKFFSNCSFLKLYYLTVPHWTVLFLEKNVTQSLKINFCFSWFQWMWNKQCCYKVNIISSRRGNYSFDLHFQWVYLS